MKIFSNRLFALTFSLFFLPTSALMAADIGWTSKAVVKLFTTQQSWSTNQPWSKNRAAQGTCSGFFIKQGILTSAHCATDATYMEVEIPGVPDKVEVHLVAINHQIDLALLKLDDSAARFAAKPITFGALPSVRDKVVTVGYPEGGRQVSFTEGVVSRIDVMRYVHSNIPAPLVQTDAPINPGNSGGPVLSDMTGDCIGIATQKSTSGEGLGYFIPTPIINQFLKDIKDGHVDGIPSLGVFFQTLENPASREYLKMHPGQSGLRVRSIAHNSSTDGILKKNDVLLNIAGHDILNDGRVPFQDDGRIWLGYYVSTKQVGDMLKLKILRDGKVKNLNIKLKPLHLTLIPQQPQYDHQMSYFVSGGLLFIAVEPRYFWNWGRHWANNLPTSLKSYIGTLYGTDNLEQLVVISEVFDASVNKGYSGEIENIRVTEVDGKEIRKLSDVKEAMEKNTKDYHMIKLVGGVQVLLDSKLVKKENKIIRQRYGIR